MLTCHLLWFLCVCNIVFSQEEFTFGGAGEEEETDAPNIIFSVSDQKSLTKSEMQFVYVICNVTNRSPDNYTIRWLNSEGLIAASNNILYFKSLLKNQEGTYNCTVEEKKSPKIKYNKVLDLKITIPSISINILSDESLKVGGKVRRQCSDLGLPPQTVTDVFSYTWINQQNKVIGNSDILEIPVVDDSINGKYICQYKSNETSKIYEASTIVDLKLATNYNIRIIPNPPNLEYGKKFALRCEVQPYYENINYTWFKNNEFVSYGQDLMFKSFKKDNVGVYKCSASLMLSSGKMNLEAESTQQFTMIRQSKIELTDKPGPYIMVHRGEKKELHCEIDTNSNNFGRDVEWYIDGKSMKEANVPNINRVDRKFVSMLVITDINSENEANYQCRVGTSIKEVNLVVLIDVGSLETSPEILKVKEGQLVEFHCRAENIPNVKNRNLKWTFESKDGLIKYSLPDSRWQAAYPEEAEQTGFIDLTRAKVSDSGYYICTEPNGRTARSELIVIPDKEAVNIIITPKEIRVRSGQRVDIECFTENNQGRASGNPVFTFAADRPIGRDSRFVVSNIGPARIRLTAPAGLSLSDNNMDVFCSSGSNTVKSKIFVKNICPPGFRNCQNGECLENVRFCNKVNDCDDKSDEDPITCRECDPISRKCQTHKGEIPKKNYFLLHWMCDGEEDCGNGFDEVNCGDFEMNNCGGKYFNCSDGKQIPRGFLCDENIDCPNGEDESDCKSPEVTKISETRITANRSQNLTLTCEAQGKPLPLIVWRFNWGCIQNSSRFLTTFTSKDCKSVSSTLDIRNFQPGDDGIYNCEALSSRQRSFSNDFQVILEKN